MVPDGFEICGDCRGRGEQMQNQLNSFRECVQCVLSALSLSDMENISLANSDAVDPITISGSPALEF
jgi:hypothetical protein